MEYSKKDWRVCMNCTQCGNRVYENDRFCESCGKPLSVNGEAETINVNDEVDKMLLKAFVGEKKESYYINKWEKNEQRSWNWAAFFASLFWLGYRKMYKSILWILLLFLIVDIIIAFIGIDSTRIDQYIGLAVAGALGISGNVEYKKFGERKIKQLEKEYSDERLLQEVQRRGGTSWKGVWLTLFLVFVYAFISTLIGELIYVLIWY